MEKELRRRRIDLITLGSGVIAFGVWSVLRAVLYVWVETPDLSDIPEDMRKLALILLCVLVGLFVAVVESLRVYVGLAARAEGMGKKKGDAYLVVTTILLAFNLVWLVTLPFQFGSNRLEGQTLLDYIASTVVDITSIVVLAELLYTALRVRKLSQELEG